MKPRMRNHQESQIPGPHLCIDCYSRCSWSFCLWHTEWMLLSFFISALSYQLHCNKWIDKNVFQIEITLNSDMDGRASGVGGEGSGVHWMYQTLNPEARNDLVSRCWLLWNHALHQLYTLPGSEPLDLAPRTPCVHPVEHSLWEWVTHELKARVSCAIIQSDIMCQVSNKYTDFSEFMLIVVISHRWLYNFLFKVFRQNP